MMRQSIFCGATSTAYLSAVVLAATTALANEPPLPVEAPRAFTSERPLELAEVRASVERALPLIELSGAECRRQRECFSCHHQALPVLTVIDARRRGFDINATNLEAQLAHTAAHLQRGRAAYADGRGQGGQVDTAGWALWALAESGRAPDETTELVTQYLIQWQAELGHWRPSGRGRAPTQGSDFTATYLALYGLSTFATSEQGSFVEARKDRVKSWLIESQPADTEDLVFRLRSLHELAVDPQVVAAAAADLMSLQHEDGGWGQTPDAASDAYATGSALATLHDTGCLNADDARYQRGLAFLLKSQLNDGSWRVTTRAKPIQIYFESGFPHGRDQFISMAATCWATMALLKACPEEG